MKPGRTPHRTALVTAGAALVVISAFMAGCSSDTKEEPTTTPTTQSSQSPTPSSSPTLTPTEKAIGPGGDLSFTPTVKAVPPGATCVRVVDGVCKR